MDIYMLYINNFIEDESILMTCLDKVQKEEKNRMLRYKNIMDLKRSLAGHMMISTIISKNKKISIKDIRIQRSNFGKPFTAFQDTNFNISHSGDIVVMAIDKHPLGIDIEQIKPIDIEQIYENFTLNEESYLRSVSSIYKNFEFYKMWTMKESFVKATGEGLLYDFSSFSVIEDNMKFSKKIKNMYIKEINIDSKYKASLCSKKNLGYEIIPTLIKSHDLVNDFLNL